MIIYISINYNYYIFNRQKNLSKPKSLNIFLLYQIIITINILITWYLLKTISEWDFYIISHLLWIVFMICIIAITKSYKEIKIIDKKFYSKRTIASIFWWISWLITLIIIKKLWISISILLSFLGTWITILFSYIFLKDIPSKKNIYLTIIVTAIVWLWYYYK